MNMSCVRPFAVAVLTTLTLGPNLAAQNPPSGRLSAAQVTQLISRGDPGDHARLSAHFATLADHRTLETYFTSLAARYDREAADHAAHAKTWRGLTRVPASAGQAAAHDREATLRRESATEVRAAASMHKDQAAKAK